MFKVRMMSCCRLVAFIYSQPLWVHEESTDGFFWGGGGWQTETGGLLQRFKKSCREKQKKKQSVEPHAGGDSVNVPCAPEGLSSNN